MIYCWQQQLSSEQLGSDYPNEFQGGLHISNVSVGFCSHPQYPGFQKKLPETNMFAIENRPCPQKEMNHVLQPSIFRDDVSFREGILSETSEILINID